jgi:hypothetical protein
MLFQVQASGLRASFPPPRTPRRTPQRRPAAERHTSAERQLELPQPPA